jgi:hypothetical protein
MQRIIRRDRARLAEFEVLKQRLLLRRLDLAQNLECHPVIIRAADQAAELASLTPFPLLVFPCLFDELASNAVEQQHKRAGLYWHALTAPPAVSAVED